MLIGHRQHSFIGEQRHVGDARQFQRVGGHHQVQIATRQGRQGRERETGRQVQFDLGPGIAELVDGRHQPLKTAVALDCHVQPSRRTTRQSGDVALGTAQLRQHGVGQLQEAQTGAGKPHRFGLAHKQRHAHALFQLLELMRQRRLRQMQALGCLHKAVSLAQGMKGFEVAYFKHGQCSMSSICDQHEKNEFVSCCVSCRQ